MTLTRLPCRCCRNGPPVKVYGGYGAPLDVRKAARAGVPVPLHQHSAGCRSHGCLHAARHLHGSASRLRLPVTVISGAWVATALRSEQYAPLR
ncbi:MAG: hypothetical protein MZV70_59715 [Desulfobacterales bacterium]|nr:hypothetical protein [Desulfobacterales bacterium]